MESSVLIVCLVLLVAIPILVAWLIDRQKECKNRERQNAVKFLSENDLAFREVVVQTDLHKEQSISDFRKLVKGKIVEECENIVLSTQNPFMCGIRLKEYLTNARDTYKNHNTLRVVSHLSQVEYEKVIDELCTSIYFSYFGDGDDVK